MAVNVFRLREAGERIAFLIHAVGAVECVAVLLTCEDGERSSRISRNERVELPAFGQPGRPAPELRHVVEDIAREDVAVIEAGVAALEFAIVVVSRLDVARRRDFVNRVSERVGELRAEVAPTRGAQRDLQRIVARIGPRLDLGDAAELWELPEERTPRVRRRRRARRYLVDVVVINQLARLIADVTDGQERIPRHLKLRINAEVLHVRRPQILVDGEDGERRVWRCAAEGGYASLDGKRAGAIRSGARIAGVEDWRRASRLTRNAASRVRTRAIIDKQVAVDDVVVDAVMAANYQIAAAPGRVRKAETRGEVVVVRRIERINIF